MNKDHSTEIMLANLLEKFELGHEIGVNDIINFKIISSQLYALADVYTFDYDGHHYYASDDYSLDDDPLLAKNIFNEVNHLLKGRPVHDPKDTSRYGVSLNGRMFYLWQSPLL